MSTPAPAVRTAGLDDPVMRMFQSVLGQPGMMSFGAGFMNPAGFDVAGVRAAFAAGLSDGDAPTTIQYGLAEGSPRLRAAIVERMAAIGVPAGPEEIVVTTGATQALDLLCNVLLDPGDAVLVERPTYVIPLQRFVLAQARVVSVPGDEDGLDPLALEAAVLEYRPKVIYTIPTFQNPGGTTLSAERRAAIAQIAERHGIWVIEDDPYRELRYVEEPPPAPIARHSRDNVIYIGTLAKTVAPGLRVGWVMAPAEIVGLCKPVKQAMDFNTSTVDQAAAAIYLEGVDWVTRTAELRAVYAAPMRAMLDRLATSCLTGRRSRAREAACSSGSSYPKAGRRERCSATPSSAGSSSCPVPCSSRTWRTTDRCGCRSRTTRRTASAREWRVCPRRSRQCRRP